ncbi:MAG: hypothetical protein P4M05_05030 [Bradyrhizobium sp.]|nr:hypothetical protein [Bradyrhizobium sp.]
MAHPAILPLDHETQLVPDLAGDVRKYLARPLWWYALVVVAIGICSWNPAGDECAPTSASLLTVRDAREVEAASINQSIKQVLQLYLVHTPGNSLAISKTYMMWY